MYRAHKKSWTSKATDWPQKRFNEKCCKYCNKVYTPNSPCNLFCSEDCAKKGKSSAYLQRQYGMTFKDYEDMLTKQGNACAICFSPGFKMAEHHELLLVVDHCHTSGKVRGLLCHNCNRALGLLKESLEAVDRVKNYLEGATTIPKGSTLK